MRHFNKKQIEEYLQYMVENVLELDELIGRCIICGESLSEGALPKGPEMKLVCLKHREHFVKDYEEEIRLGNIIDTNADGIVIKTYEEQRKEELLYKASDKLEGLAVGEIILLDWIHLKKVSKEKPNYFDRWYGIDCNLSSNKLNEEGYIRIGTPLESIYSLTLDELRKILKKHYLKTTGRKKDYLERIKNELNEEDYADFIEPTWILTEKGQTFLKNYNVLVWAHKKYSTVGYSIAVTPYSVVPYVHLNKSNEMVAISVTEKVIKKCLFNKESYYDVTSNCLFQAKMYNDLRDKKNSLDSLLLGLLICLRYNYEHKKSEYTGVSNYQGFKKELVSIPCNFSNEYIINRTKSMYADYEYLLPEIRLYEGLSDFVEALSVTLWGTEKEWKELINKWKNKNDKLEYFKNYPFEGGLEG